VHELARVIRARPRRNAKGGGRPAAGERRRGVRLGKNKREAGRSFLTTRRSLGGREGGREDGGGEDRRRRPEFKGWRWRARLGAREPAREVGELDVSEGWRGEV
jgi:hypothetical protein